MEKIQTRQRREIQKDDGIKKGNKKAVKERVTEFLVAKRKCFVDH